MVKLGEGVVEKDAAAGGRFSAPGSEAVSELDLGASWAVIHCRTVLVRASP